MEQQIYLIGLNYRTAGVEVLTDHCSKDTWAIPLRPSGENDSAETTLDEALILSTCNRVEILAVGQGDVPGLILEAWASAKNRKAVELAPYVYIHKGREAIAHLFTVASSLDSMVLGEPQILGQLKGAYRKATLAGTTKTIINRLLHKSFSVAKRVRKPALRRAPFPSATRPWSLPSVFSATWANTKPCSSALAKWRNSRPRT